MVQSADGLVFSNPYLDSASSVRLLLEPSIRTKHLDEVLVPYRDRRDTLTIGSMVEVLNKAAEIRGGCPEYFRIE